MIIGYIGIIIMGIFLIVAASIIAYNEWKKSIEE